MTEAWQEIADELARTKPGYSPDLNYEQVLALVALLETRDQLVALLQELLDIEGPQPGTAVWAAKVRSALAKAST